MATTVQVSEETLQILKRLKEETGLKSLDEVIRGTRRGENEAAPVNVRVKPETQTLLSQRRDSVA